MAICKACERYRHPNMLDGNNYCLTDTEGCRQRAVIVTLRRMGKTETAERRANMKGGK